MRERRALLLLIPLMAVLAWILYSAGRSHFDGSAEVIGDGFVQREAGTAGQESGDTVPEPAFAPEEFDPNTVTYEELRAMGLASNAAASLIRSRERGKVFQIPEDFATGYGITDSIYAVFKPYIRIGEEYRIKPYASGTGTSPNPRPAAEVKAKKEIITEPFDPNEYTAEDFTRLGFSPKQSDVIIRYRDSRGGFRRAEDLASCYVVSEEMFARLKDFIVIPAVEGGAASGLVELNTADSLTLVSVRGIGARSAEDIIAYRGKLGGFHEVGQLTELEVMTERNYELICRQIWVDSCVIRKIDINFATPKEIGDHPYVADRTLRRILKNRQLKGGWSTTEEMIEDNTLTTAEAARLAPYLQFTVPQP